jgi:hypothetical protein
VYPQVGSIVAFTGAICGFYFIFLVPVCLYAKYSKPLRSSERRLTEPQDIDMVTTTRTNPNATLSDMGGSGDHHEDEELADSKSDMHSFDNED